MVTSWDLFRKRGTLRRVCGNLLWKAELRPVGLEIAEHLANAGFSGGVQRNLLQHLIQEVAMHLLLQQAEVQQASPSA